VERYILANLDRVFRKDNGVIHLEFYFDSDYTIEEIEHEVQRKLRSFNDMRSFGDWTTVPEVRHKLKVMRVKYFRGEGL